MSKFFKLFLILIAFSFSINSEAAKRGSFGGSHGWGKQSHSSPVKFKKNKKKNKYKAVSASAVAAAGLFSSSKGSVTEENNHIDKKSKNNDYEKISKETNWANHELLEEHYLKHGHDFNSTDAKDYAEKATDFYSSRKNHVIRKKIDKRGVTRMWNPETNEFGSYDNKGKTKTYFKPGRKDYFDDQKGVEINE